MPTDLSVAVIGAAAVITASIIGLIVAVTTAVIAKEQKVSEFRQAWIDAFRNEMAELLALSFSYSIQKQTFQSLKKKEPTKELYNKMELAYNNSRDIMKDIFKLTALLQLRLNNNGEHEEFFKHLNNLHDSMKSPDTDVDTDLKHAQLLMSESHIILKSEWERVKQGERLFKIFKQLGKFLASTLMIAIYILFTIALVASPNPIF